MGFDIARVRGLYPGLGDGWVHFDAQAGMRVPESVAATVAVAMRTAVSAPGGSYPSSQRGQAIADGARSAIADLVGADGAGVVLGAGRGALLERLAEALGSRLTLGTEVVVSRLDEHDNTAPWQRVARQRGATVRWAEIDIETCELPEWQYADLIGEATKVVAVTAASSSLGTCPDVRAIAERAHAVGALVVVDATALAPFAPLSMDALDADVLVVSSAEWGGPPMGALAFRDPALLEKLPSFTADPRARGSVRLEIGHHQYPMLAGLIASVEHLAGLCPEEAGPEEAGHAEAGHAEAGNPATGHGLPTRRDRLQTSMAAVACYQHSLHAYLADSLRALTEVMVLGNGARRNPTLSFTVGAVPAEAVTQRLADNGMCALRSQPNDGVFDALGVADVGGAVQVGLGHYTTTSEVDQLVRVVASFG